MNKNLVKIAFLLFVMFFVSSSVLGSHSDDSSDEKEFDVNELIMHHIKDAYSWHILDYKKDGETHSVSIPLPIILIGNGQFDVFMSSQFHHGKHSVKRGDNTYIMHHGSIYFANAQGGITFFLNDDGEMMIENKKPLDFSITKNVAAIMVVALLLLLIFISVARAYKKRPGRPSGMQAFLEPVILFVKTDIAIPNIGEKKADKYLPYLLTVFFFILFSNLLGLVPFFPGGANITGNIAVTFVLAFLTMIIVNVSGNRQYWKHIFASPGVPIWLYPIMIPVELIGIISKPFALMIRLFANITAGHIIVLSLVSLIFIFKALWIATIAVPFVLFMDVLEVLVAFLQAYIFTMLTALFIGLAVQESH